MSDLGDIYWNGCADGKILYQECPNCAHVLSYPRPFCETCGQKKPNWKEASKQGRVAGATSIHKAPTEEFGALAPYRLLLVDLVEGTRIIAHGDQDVVVGDNVTIDFIKVSDRHLPYCKKAS